MRTKLVILCAANRYRSPLAAAFLGRYSHLDVRSAGFKPGGLRAGKPVREAARGFGFDLEDHRSVEVSRELMDWASYVVVMNPTQLDKLTGLFGPAKRERRVLLGSYLNFMVQSIPDLGFINGSSPEFGRVVSMIKDATTNLAECLKPNANIKSLKSSSSARP